MNSNRFTVSFIDIYGVPHPEAVAMVSSISMQASANISEAGEAQSGYSTLSYQVRFWHNEAARTAGAQSQMFVAPLVGDGLIPIAMSLSGEAALLPAEQWAAACQSHFETVVIPQLPSASK